MSDNKGTCALCKSQDELCASHVIPKFVFDRIKKNSPTGYLRCSSDINKRQQDGPKYSLLCRCCEQRFSQTEKYFAEQVYAPFWSENIPPLEYTNWLYYFITSVTWRTLLIRLPQPRKDYTGEPATILEQTEQDMREYLLNTKKSIMPAKAVYY